MVRSKLILVAGMHRSGTSALTRALNLAGLPLPGNLLEPLPANPDGYWEPVDVILLHNRMLESLGSCWDDFRAIPRAWFAGAEAAAFAAELGRWIEGEMGGGGALLVKDPRICRFLPLWAAVCGRLNIDVHAILAVRNPLEVVASLERRNKFPAIKSALLWSRYFIDAERDTRGWSRCFVDYDALLKAPLATVRRISNELGVTFPVSDTELDGLLAEALKVSLRHHIASTDQLARAGNSASPPMVAYPWALAAAAGKNPPVEVLDRLAADLEEVERGHGIVYAPSA